MAYHASDYTAPAIASMQSAANAYGDAGENLQKAVEIAFAAVLAADPVLDADTASGLLAEALKGYPSIGPRRTWATSFFNDVNTVRDLREKVGDPAALDVATFCERLATWCADKNSRKFYEAAQKAKKADAKRAVDEAKARAAMQTHGEEAPAAPKMFAPGAPVEAVYAGICDGLVALRKADAWLQIEDLHALIEDMILQRDTVAAPPGTR